MRIVSHRDAINRIKNEKSQSFWPEKIKKISRLYQKKNYTCIIKLTIGALVSYNNISILHEEMELFFEFCGLF